MSEQLREFWLEDRLLACLAEPARDASPEDIFLKLNPLSRIEETVGPQLPKLIDADGIALGAKSWPQKETCQNQPGFLVINGSLAVVDLLVEGLPELRE